MDQRLTFSKQMEIATKKMPVEARTVELGNRKPATVPCFDTSSGGLG